jgi:hypothetical protein
MRTLGLLTLCALLSAAIWVELAPQRLLQRADKAPAPVGHPSSNAGGTANAIFTFPPLQQYTEVVERTLFDASRRALPEESEEAPAAAAAELRDLVLTGVVVTPQAKIAFFRDKTPNQIIRLEPGEAFGKWVVADVRAHGVTLRRGAASREFVFIEGDDAVRAKTANVPLASQVPLEAEARETSTPQPSEVKSQPPMRSSTAVSPQRPATRVQRRAQRRAGAAAKGDDN